MNVKNKFIKSIRSMNGKVVLVTGSSKGIGAELVKNLAQIGARLMINYSKSKELADEVLQIVREYTKEVIANKSRCC